MNTYVYRISLLFILIHAQTFAQIKPHGNPYIRNYTIEEYEAHTQNWDIEQDDRGIMYFANGSGVLEFDGSTWRVIPTPKQTVVRSLYKAPDGTIYAGANGELGYLAPDTLSGQTRWYSLMQLLPSEDREFNEVWDLHGTGDSLFVQTSSKIYLINLSDKKVEVFYAESRFHISFWVHNTFYVREWGKGLLKLKNGSLELAPFGALFADERVYGMLPYDTHQILIVSRTQGFFLMDSTGIRPWIVPATGFIKNNLAYVNPVILQKPDPTADPKLFALSTLDGGILIIDTKGNIVKIINEAVGLQENVVYGLYTDHAENLWVALNNGISMIETGAPLSFFNDHNGLPQINLRANIYNDILYVGTSTGLYYKPWTPQANNFLPVPEVTGLALGFLDVQNNLHVGHAPGYYKINGSEAQLMGLEDMTVWMLDSIPGRKSSFFAGTKTGIAILEARPEGLVYKHHVQGFDIDARYTVWDNKGYFWVTNTSNSGIYRVRPNADFTRAEDVRFFTEADGLPINFNDLFVFKGNNGQPVFTTDKGLYRFDYDAERLETIEAFNKHLRDTSSFSVTFIDKQGTVYFMQKGWGIMHKTADGYRPDYQTLAPLNGTENEPKSMFVHNNGDVLIATYKGLVHYDPRIQKDQKAYSTHIRRVKVLEIDSILFEGTFTNMQNKMIPGQDLSRIPQYGYQTNNLRFEYSATFFEYDERNRFQYQLAGFDKDWSAWTDEIKKDYTNLAPGRYTFKVRAKNLYDKLGEEASYSFVILPPWYLTIYAYAAYFLIFVGFVYGVVHLNARRLKKQNALLEQTVEERTAEIEEQKEEITVQRDEIEAQRDYLSEALERLQKTQKQLIQQEKMASLGVMSAGLAHEINNPLNYIKQSSSYLKKTLTDEEGHQMVIDAIEEGISRIQGITDSLRKYSRQSEEMNEDCHLPEIIDSCFHIMTTQLKEDVEIIRGYEENTPPLKGNNGKLSQAFLNFIANAVDATNAGNKIEVQVYSVDGAIKVAIVDTGVGIAPEHLSKVGDPFFTTKEVGKGTGLGVYLAGEIIHLHAGSYKIASELGKGTTVIVTFKTG